MNEELRQNVVDAIRELANAYHAEAKHCQPLGIPGKYSSLHEWVRDQIEADDLVECIINYLE